MLINFIDDSILVALEANCVVCKLFLGYKTEKLRDRSIILAKEGQFFLDMQKLDAYMESGFPIVKHEDEQQRLKIPTFQL
ncbi:hypothetical protein L3X38_031098 [Prunus dulcis]|uniref:Uncharacterized protein n=1 Tax=Prunus dulcis TaxID=3755 RepID=A0AAD4YUP9_PRUDU|nr:hypothetical protein L3X38_031098 [Prunus dulcis]